MKLHLPKALLAAIVAVGAALPAMQAEEADTSTTTVLSSTDLSYNPTIYTLGDPLNNTLAAVYQTTLVPAEGSEPAKWDVAETASTKGWGELYGDGYGAAANTDNYNTLRVVSAKEYGFNFSTLSLAGVIVESTADGASFKGLGSGTRNIKIGKTGEESASYFGGSFTFDSYTASNNESSISLAGTQTWYIKGDETVTLKAKNGISNGGSLTISGGGKLALSSNFTNTGTLALVGSELTINHTLTGTVTADSASTINVANIDLLNKRLANKDSWSNGMEANGKVELAFDYIVAESGINGKASYTYNGEQKKSTLTDGSYIRENESAYGVVTGSKLSEIVGAVKNNGGNYIIIKDGITLTRDTTNAGFTTPQKLTGAGIYDLGEVSKKAASAVLGNNMTLDKTWTGTVVLSGGVAGNNNDSSVHSINFNDLGNANSTVEITGNGLFGYLSGSTTYNPNIKLSADFTIQNGNSNYQHTFAGKISGGGALNLHSVCPSNGAIHSFTFTNDISEWKGSINAQDKNGDNTADIVNTITFTNGANEVNVAIERESGILNMVVNNSSDTTLNKDVKVSLLTATGLKLGSGADITLTGSATNSSITKIIADASGNTITLQGETAKLNRIASVTGGAVTLKGNGIYDMTGNSDAANVTLTDSEWSGKVIFNGTINGLGLSNKGHSGSSVELNGWDGYFKQEVAEFSANISLNNGSGGYAVKITDGYSSLIDNWTKTAYTFSGDISGSGVWEMKRTGKTGTLSQNYVLTGDISGWDGSFVQNGQHDTKLTINGTSSVNATIDNQSGTLDVTVDDANITADDKSVALNKAITATSLTLGNSTDTDAGRASVTVNENVTVDTLTNHAATKLANGKSLTTGALSVGSADGANAATLTGGAITKTETGATVSNMTLDNAKLTGADANTAITLQDVAGAATLATGTYTVAAVAGAATAAAEDVALSYTLGGLTGLTLANADTKLVINTENVLAAVGDAESFTLSFNFGDGISLYDGEWTAEALSGAITFGGALGEWLSGSETEYTLASDAVATASLDGLVPTVTYAMTNGVLTSITVSGNIPEPTTATLSLLALAALAARRRRK